MQALINTIIFRAKTATPVQQFVFIIGILCLAAIALLFMKGFTIANAAGFLPLIIVIVIGCAFYFGNDKGPGV